MRISDWSSDVCSSDLRETGRVFRRNEELFAENSWVQVMLGQGIEPRSYHPIATKLRDDELDRLLKMLRGQVADTVASLPDPQAYVARYCGAEVQHAALSQHWPCWPPRRRRCPPAAGREGAGWGQ